MNLDVELLKKTNLEYYRQVVQDTIDMLDQSLISVHVSATYKLKDINKAVEFITEKKCTGKVVVEVDDD